MQRSDGRSAHVERALSVLFPAWGHLSAGERDGLVRGARLLRFGAGDHVHGAQRDEGSVLLVLSGSLRAYLLSPETGREVTLFFVGGGENCVLSASRILSMIDFDVFVDAVGDTSVLSIDADRFDALMKGNVHVEAAVYRQTAERFSEVMWLMYQVVFCSLDARLAAFLLDEAQRTGASVVTLTHAEIAGHIGSAREVVSRMLKLFSQEGLVELSRGSVALVDREALRKRAAARPAS
ncbi:Crp/Fnr family transcriptional regulator [Berryella intestinalis]|uniref:Crp/Fnr family transcriptional regulator n=1 Tax=Berryella intestinalis TaxID=1531429 RepID=UPI0006899751|nr:Crp/Fnr family transcriptional regulator [Berryella intestinalis]